MYRAGYTKANDSRDWEWNMIRVLDALLPTDASYLSTCLNPGRGAVF